MVVRYSSYPELTPEEERELLIAMDKAFFPPDLFEKVTIMDRFLDWLDDHTWMVPVLLIGVPTLIWVGAAALAIWAIG
jgi:hypothetical protein